MKISRGWLQTAASMALGDVCLIEYRGGLELRSFSEDMNSQRADWSEARCETEARAPIIDRRKLLAAVNMMSGSEIEVRLDVRQDSGSIVIVGATSRASLPCRLFDSVPMLKPAGPMWYAPPKFLNGAIPDAGGMGQEWSSKHLKPTLAMHLGGLLAFGGHAAWWRKGEGIGTYRFSGPPEPGRWAGDDVEMTIDEASATLWVTGNGFLERYRGLQPELEGRLRYLADMEERAKSAPYIEAGRQVLIERLKELLEVGVWPPSAIPAVGIKFDAKKKKAKLYTWRSQFEGECDLGFVEISGKCELACFSPKYALAIMSGAKPEGNKDGIRLAVVTKEDSDAKYIIIQSEQTGESGLIAGLAYKEEDRALEAIPPEKKPKSTKRKGPNKGESDEAPEAVATEPEDGE